MAVGKWAIGLGQKIRGIELGVRRSGGIDDRSIYVFMPNHVSFLDGLMLYMLIPQALLVILKKSLFRIPIVGQGMKVVGFVPVDWRHSGGGKKSIEKAVRLMGEKGFSFLIFPEGTRSLDGRLQPLRRGGFFLALEAPVPIVPVAINGAFEIMPKGRFFVRRGESGSISWTRSRSRNTPSAISRRLSSGSGKFSNLISSLSVWVMSIHKVQKTSLRAYRNAHQADCVKML
jgi:1-acyl-sn-glycerol-3-phosphate acyltransferase